jgi:hypothetical protein
MRKRVFKRQVGVLLTDETYDLLIKITDAKEVPLSEFVRDIVEKTLQELGKEKHTNGK